MPRLRKCLIVDSAMPPISLGLYEGQISQRNGGQVADSAILQSVNRRQKITVVSLRRLGQHTEGRIQGPPVTNGGRASREPSLPGMDEYSSLGIVVYVVIVYQTAPDQYSAAWWAEVAPEGSAGRERCSYEYRHLCATPQWGDQTKCRDVGFLAIFIVLAHGPLAAQ
jgi:hypothetical protein